jgi:hypothetical protein
MKKRQPPRLLSREFAAKISPHFAMVALIVGGSLLGGMVGYVYLAELSWVDAFVNAAMLLGGMGPVNELHSDAAKIFAGLYALYAGLIFIASAGILVTPIAHHILQRFHMDDTD